MVWEDIEDMPTTNLRQELLSLLNKELEYAPLPLAVAATCAGPSDGDGDSLDALRRNVCQWNYECVDYFLFDREVVYLSMNYFDRFMAAQIAASDRTYRTSVKLGHLLALTSLYVASKLHGVATGPSPCPSYEPPASARTGRPRKIRLEDFCIMSRGAYCPRMLEEMEMLLLTNLQWKVHPPTPTDFLIRYVKILSLVLSYYDRYDQCIASDMDVVVKGWSAFEVARYQLELAVYDHELCRKFPPSKLALAAFLNAMDSKIVRTKRTIISPLARLSFLNHLKCLGGGFAHLNVEGDDIVEIRSSLKKLCSKTIVLPGEILDDAPSIDITFTPIAAEAKTFEYELPDVPAAQLASGSSISPVTVAADLF
jgi:hypothetical protein